MSFEIYVKKNKDLIWVDVNEPCELLKEATQEYEVSFKDGTKRKALQFKKIWLGITKKAATMLDPGTGIVFGTNGKFVTYPEIYFKQKHFKKIR